MVERLFTGGEIDRGEVVFGVVGALGTNVRDVQQRLQNSLVRVGYDADVVHVSKLIETACAPRIADLGASETGLDQLMDRGDFLRREVGHGGAAAALTIAEIAGGRNAGQYGDEAAPERESFATIIRQLKHPEEVRLLRSVYGPRFILVGVWAPVDERRKSIRDRLKSLEPAESDGWYEHHVSRLMQRDEKDAAQPFGQRVRNTFELADAFVSLVPGEDVGGQLDRIVSLLFGDPFVTPTHDEYAMSHASMASFRSSDAGRQVGVIVTDDAGEVLVAGVNEVPKAYGGQYWSGDSPDFRDFQIGYDVNERQKLGLITDVLMRLRAAGWLSGDRQSRAASGNNGTAVGARHLLSTAHPRWCGMPSSGKDMP